MRRRSATRTRGVGAPLRVGGALSCIVLWYLPVAVSIGHAPAFVTVILSVVTVAALVLWSTRRDESSMATCRRYATMRMRRIGPATPWVAGMAFVMPVNTILLGALLGRWGYPLGQASTELDAYIGRPDGWLALGAVVVLVAPVVEELGFLGWIQHPLERRLGTMSGIAISAGLFALAHGSLPRLPLLFLDGLLLGGVVYLTRSIWAGIVVHAGNNALIAASLVPSIAAALARVGIPSAGTALAALGANTLLFAFLARGLWRATRRAGRPARRAPACALAPDESRP